MRAATLSATIERQIWSRFRTTSFWISTTVPVTVIGVLLFQTAKATDSPSSTMFLAILSALWIGGSSCVREIVDERKLVQREPHLSLLAYGIAKLLHVVVLAAGQSVILTVFLALGGILKIPVFSLWAIVFLTAVSGATLALILSALCDEPATALAWFPLLLVPQVVFGGFLFFYGSTTPFAVSTDTAETVVMPSELRREPVEQWITRTIGAVCVSRWALETFAAETYEQDLEDRDQFENAVQVAGFIPLTLVDTPVSETLLDYAMQLRTPNPPSAPKIDANSNLYFGILALFAGVQSVALILILPLRDPRRA